MSGERLVLRNKTSGKIASRSDQITKAIVLKAIELSNGDQNNGIPSLLVPRSTKEKDEISAIDKIYEVCLVKSRPGKKSGTSDKKRLLDAQNNAVLFAKLSVHFGKFVGDNPLPHAISGKAFSKWLKGELKKNNSKVYLIAKEHAPVLLEVEREDRWWADSYARRRKTQS